MASSPIVRATIQSCGLTAVSNMLAQTITAYRTESPYTINWTPVFQFILFTILNCPLNFLWQQFLESLFPSLTLQPSESAIVAAASNDEKELDAEQTEHSIVEPRLNVRNTVLKLCLDLTVGAAANIMAFSIVMAGFRGASLEQALQSARQDLWPMMVAGLRLWPLVSLLSYTVLKSVEARTLLGSLAGMVWGVYLSLVAGNK